MMNKFRIVTISKLNISKVSRFKCIELKMKIHLAGSSLEEKKHFWRIVSNPGKNSLLLFFYQQNENKEQRHSKSSLM